MARRREVSATPFDHFVYRAGDGAGPPSLSLLPALKVRMRYEEDTVEPKCRPLFADVTGILRRGGSGEFLVARIEVLCSGGRGKANLCVLRLGSSQWELKCLVPVAHEDGDEVMGPLTGPAVAIPVGDRFLCWVGLRCFILCDMADAASPNLRHVPLPGPPYDHNYYTDNLCPLTGSYTLGAAGTAVRHVAVEPRCCCGGLGRSACPRALPPRLHGDDVDAGPVHGRAGGVGEGRCDGLRGALGDAGLRGHPARAPAVPRRELGEA
ncbi:hypothetical protein PVAP13_8NG062601 [Panicum virgatum]|uniref:DUF1618 domain-containing protein n=1 Tax=Panicum virgatum TaxID=38727 RepID=A0A8T0P585_PANVG|nr:hypothetical protein PVAP13_8NG062601 [Panicum virgatum]